jgi:cytochrome c biogenesis protein CcmG/thiol:disulfide interchange protein DsbE
MRFGTRLKAGVLSFLIVLLLAFGCQGEAKSGPMAPVFKLRDLSGQMVSLDQYRGRVVLLDFWATWCPPCRLSIPELIEVQDQYRDKGLVVLGVSMDDPNHFPIEYIRAFKEKSKINYNILRFDSKVVQDYFGYDAPAIPTMFVIDREGRIRDKFVGYQPGAVKDALAGVLK